MLPFVLLHKYTIYVHNHILLFSSFSKIIKSKYLGCHFPFKNQITLVNFESIAKSSHIFLPNMISLTPKAPYLPYCALKSAKNQLKKSCWTKNGIWTSVHCGKFMTIRCQKVLALKFLVVRSIPPPPVHKSKPV